MHRVLKELASELGPMFAHLLQQFVHTGDIPKACKHMYSLQIKEIGLWLEITDQFPLLSDNTRTTGVPYSILGSC